MAPGSAVPTAGGPPGTLLARRGLGGWGEGVAPGKRSPVLGCAARLAATGVGVPFRVLCLPGPGVSDSPVRRGPNHGWVPLCVPGWLLLRFIVVGAARHQRAGQRQG